LAPALHQNHKDTNPSFGMSYAPDETSRYNCFACGHGSAIELIQAMEFHGIKADFAKAREILEAEELEVVPLPGYGEFQINEVHFVYRPWPEMWLEQFQSAQYVPLARDYLLNRDVTLAEMQKFDLRWDVKRMMVVFPIREAYGTLAGARGRSVMPDASGPDKHHDYSHEGTPKNIKGVWYNEQALHLPGPVVVVEGQFDCLRMAKAWPKTVGNLTALPTDEKLMKLALTDGVIHIPDADKTGTQSIAKFQAGLLKYGTPYRAIDLKEHGVKDPGECHPDFLLGMVQAAAKTL
jgi:DNA primase